MSDERARTARRDGSFADPRLEGSEREAYAAAARTGVWGRFLARASAAAADGKVTSPTAPVTFEWFAPPLQPVHHLAGPLRWVNRSF